jgi:hypothetical protein
MYKSTLALFPWRCPAQPLPAAYPLRTVPFAGCRHLLRRALVQGQLRPPS